MNKEVMVTKVEGAKSFVKKHGKKFLIGAAIAVGAVALAHKLNKKNSIDADYEVGEVETVSDDLSE